MQQTADTPDGRPLGFWESACDLIHAAYGGTGCVLQVAAFDGTIDADSLGDALRSLQRRHPLLRARKEGGAGGRARFVVVDSPAMVPLTVVERSSDDQWRSVAEELLLRGPEPALWKAVWLPSEGRSELLFVFHHAISDGLSTVGLVGELLALCSGVGESAPLPLLAPVEVLLARPVSCARYLVGQVAMVLRTPTMTPVPFVQDVPLSDRRTRNLFGVLERDELARLLERCRAEDTTVNAALNAAVALAAAHRNGPGESVVYSHPAVDLRSRCDPPVARDHVGCFVTVVSTAHRVAPTTPFWELARACRRDLSTAIEHRSATPAHFHTGMLRRMLTGLTDGANRSGRFSMGCGVSNLGRWELGPTPAGCTLRELYFSTSRRAGDLSLYLHTVTTEGRLFACLAYPSPLVDDASAKAAMEQVMARLRDPDAAR